MIYFIKNLENGYIKIGFTTNIKRRHYAIKHNLNGASLEILGAMRGGVEKEKQLHKKFSHLNVTGEWFSSDSELLSFINVYTRKPNIDTSIRNGNYVAGPGRDSFEKIYGESAHRFALRLPESLYQQLVSAAEASDMSVNHYIITLLQHQQRQQAQDEDRPTEH